MDTGPGPKDHFGLLNLAKPAGTTSRHVVNRVQRVVRPAKAGHAGTLDPLATGVLVVCVGRATRLVPLIQELRKTYRATFLLGRTSDTDDVDGTVRKHAAATRPTRGQVLETLPEFIGRIEQRPPAYSAVKISGQRAHALARKGQDVELEERPVDVYSIDVLRYEYPELVLEIECGSGTYVRSIGRDLGEQLGCGAVMSALQRTAIGPFHVQTAVPLERITRQSLPNVLLPATAALDLPQVVVDDDAVRAFSNGRCVPCERPTAGDAKRSAERPQPVAVVDEAGTLVALADVDGDDLVPRQVFARRR